MCICSDVLLNSQLRTWGKGYQFYVGWCIDTDIMSNSQPLHGYARFQNRIITMACLVSLHNLLIFHALYKLNNKMFFPCSSYFDISKPREQPCNNDDMGLCHLCCLVPTASWTHRWCETSVPSAYVSNDDASRELVVDPFSEALVK